MAIRFRKSIKLAPGIRWNISGSGSSWTIGTRGASLGIGKRGTFLNAGIPGTGISSRNRLSAGEPKGTRTRNEPSPSTTTSVSLTCAISEDGTIIFTDFDGTPAPEHLIELAKKQNREAIQNLIKTKCDEINDQIEALARLHHDTPCPTSPRYSVPEFKEPRPEPPLVRDVRLFDRFFPGRPRRIAAENNTASVRFQDDLAAWTDAKAKFDREVAERKLFVEERIYTDVSAMERYLEERLAEVVWPRETTVAFEIPEDGRRVSLEVDLPELEDMPSKLAAVPAKGLKLSVKELSPSKVQKLYAEHVHGIVFRLVGEVFAALPAAHEVVAAGYSQRRNSATAQLNDEYLISVRVGRDEWQTIDFNHLHALDITDALSRFDLRRQMLKSGVLRSISPHTT
ncbi:MAG: DUF4236 domain-containing protein [Lysobacterales bacterium]